MKRDYSRRSLFGGLSSPALMVGLYILYVNATDLNQLLPPMLGVLYIMFHISLCNGDVRKATACIVCATFFELNKLLVFGLFPISFLATRLFVSERLESILNHSYLFTIAYIVSMYSFYIAGEILCSVMIKTEVIGFRFMYIWYLLCDIVVSIMYVRLVVTARNQALARQSRMRSKY